MFYYSISKIWGHNVSVKYFKFLCEEFCHQQRKLLVLLISSNLSKVYLRICVLKGCRYIKRKLKCCHRPNQKNKRKFARPLKWSDKVEFIALRKVDLYWSVFWLQKKVDKTPVKLLVDEIKSCKRTKTIYCQFCGWWRSRGGLSSYLSTSMTCKTDFITPDFFRNSVKSMAQNESNKVRLTPPLDCLWPENCFFKLEESSE